MTTPPFEIRPFPLTGATREEYAALNRLGNRAKAEMLPDDPPTPLEQTIAELQNLPPVFVVQAWAAWSADGAEMVGDANVGYMEADENRHLVQFDVYVLPEHRRQGLGTELLRRAVAAAQSAGRRLMMTGTNERVPAGEVFLSRIGAERGLEMHTNQLTLAELDHALIARWQAEGQARAAGFTLGLWDGPYPDDQLEAIAALNDVMNTAPRDGLDMEDMHFTPEHIRQMEQQMTAGGTQRWTLYATESATGRFAGFTEIFWNPNRPQIVSQGATGVFPEFRGKGLGRWLKAAMLDRVIRERPEARFVRTGNADSNAAMLGINQALGFQPYMSRCVWQLDTDKALTFLEGKAEKAEAG